MEKVYNTTKDDIAFDTNNILDLKAVGRFLSTKLVYGINSDEYKEALKEFNEIRKRNLEFKGIVEKGKGKWAGSFIASSDVNQVMKDGSKKKIGVAVMRITLIEENNILNGKIQVLGKDGKASKGIFSTPYKVKGTIIRKGIAQISVGGETATATISDDGNTITIRNKKDVQIYRRE